MLRGLGLPSERRGDERCLDLGSLRAGGATFLLMLTEDSELVRRRGRWMAHRTMEIYLQEVGAAVFFPSLQSCVKDRILRLATAFPELLQQMLFLTKVQIPPTAWFVLFQAGTDGKNGQESWEDGLGSERSRRQQSKNQGKVEKKGGEQLAVAVSGC